MHFILTLKYIDFYIILYDGKHTFPGGHFRGKMFFVGAVRRRARRVRGIFRKYVFIAYSTYAHCT